MATASLLAYHLDPRVRAVLAFVVMAWSVLVLLAFVASLLDPAIAVPSPDGQRVAPFRWHHRGDLA